MIWRIVQDVEHYDSLVLPRSESYSKFDDLEKPQPVADRWAPLTVKVSDGEKMGDFPYLTTHIPVFSKRALKVLQPLIGKDIEALVLRCESFDLYAIHILTLLDCLDESRSYISRDSDGEIMEISKFVFKENCVGDQHIFRLTLTPEKYVFVSDQFKSAVEKNKLRGLFFKKSG